MILRSTALSPAPTHEYVSAWKVVEKLQRQDYSECWMITQPSHAALAGEIAAALCGPTLPRMEPDLVRAIAMHDAGWGMPDAQMIMRSQSQGLAPRSFLQCTVGDFLAAWIQSIEIAQSTSAAGGYIVSRHFWRLAEHRLSSGNDTGRDLARLQSFIQSEAQRQQKLASKYAGAPQELETLADVLQFCDLLSLYLCCGARENVEFPQYFGVHVRLKVHAEGYKLEPGLVPAGTEFRVAALRHPATRQVSSQEIVIRFVS